MSVALITGALTPTIIAGALAADALGTSGAAVPVLDWSPCAGAPGYECATAEVPLS